MDRGIDFAETFRRQYLFSQEPVDVPDTWVSYRIAGGRLAVCPELDVTRIVTSGNKTLGYVLGIALTDESVLLSDTYVLDDEDVAAIEAWVESLSGRYVVILGTAAFRRLYVDPSCSLVTFYNPQNGRAGTSLPLVLDRPVEDNPALPRDVYRERAGTYYILGDTADRAVRRMISNHFLDLRTFEIHRHWPKPDMDFSPAETPTVALDTIVQRLARHVHTLMRDRICAFPISAGDDNRLLLTYEAIPDNARQAAVDFGHFEIWLPAVANTTYQTMANHFMMNPFNDRLLLQKTAQLPYKFRKLGRPQRYIIRTCLPEIRDVPYASKDLLKRLNTPSDDRNVFQSMGWV